MTAAKLISTGFFLGFCPVMPGTVGSLVGLGLSFFLKGHSFIQWLILSLLFIAGVWSASTAERALRKNDPPQVIVDEIFAMLLIAAFLPRNTAVLLAAFVLFRVFDILKPPPIKKIQGLHAGIGIMLDDVAAGAYTFIIIRIALKLIA